MRFIQIWIKSELVG